MTTYKIVRHFFTTNRKLTVKRRLALEEAQQHCHSRETSSSTATSAEARKRTKRWGPWFDGYTEDK